MSVSSPAQPVAPVTRLGLAAYVLAAFVIAVDQLSKAWVVGALNLGQGGSLHISPVFSLTMVWNQGVSYGLLSSHSALGRWGLVVFSLVIAIALGVWVRRQVRWLPATAIGLIMGGAVGNAVDRARLGHVVDFLDFAGLHFPWVFNVADSAISVGVALLLLDSVLARSPPHP